MLERHLNKCNALIYMGFPDGTVVKNPPVNAGDTRDAGLILGSETAHSSLIMELKEQFK